MDRVTHRFARFYAPGSFVANDWTAPVKTLDPAAVKWPENAYAFTLHERVDVIDGPETFTGKAKQVGPMYYHPDSKIETLAEVKAKRPDSRTLIANMECNGWSHIVWSRWGNWPQPFDATEACVLAAA